MELIWHYLNLSRKFCTFENLIVSDGLTLLYSFDANNLPRLHELGENSLELLRKDAEAAR